MAHKKHGGKPSQMSRQQLKLPRFPLAVGLGFPRQDPDNDNDNDAGDNDADAQPGQA